MLNNNKEIVLVTGGAGFLGQHIIRELQTRDSGVEEIRVLDLKPYHKFLSYKEGPVKIVSIVGNIVNKESIKDVFQGVTCVFHCAAHISYEYPANEEVMKRNNVEGTRNIISLCQEYDVSKLIFTSTAEVAFVPYLGSTCISIIVNQTESRALPPLDERESTIPEYATSKLEAENIVLAANATQTKNGLTLKTIALRPPLIYGEQDPSFITSVVSIAHRMGGTIPRIAGSGGKQQTVYAGNVAWSHLCAMTALEKESEDVSGLPVFITDDTTICDTARLCEKLTERQNKRRPLCKQSWWSIPLVVSMILAMIIQTLSKVTGIKVPVSPCALISYLGSFILFSRLRASIHLGYNPIYNEEETIAMSSCYYTRYYNMLEDKECLKNICK